MMMKKRLISIIPSLEGGKGHMLQYHLAVHEACCINHWEHSALYSSAPSSISLPSGWECSLNNGQLEKKPSNLFRDIGLLKTLSEILTLSRSVSSGLAKIINPNKGEYVLFIERFNAFQLLAFILAFVRLTKSNATLWMMLRHEPSESIFVRWLNYFLVHSTRLLFGKSGFKLIADSEPLASQLSKFFKIKTHVLPIPHTGHLIEDFEKDNSKLVLWWPGSPRPEKGWEIIKNIAKRRVGVKLTQRIQLVVSESSEIAEMADSDFEIRLINNVLSGEDYAAMFAQADFVLLPYDSSFYKTSTSGIFVETLVAKKIPLVSDNNWMSYELKRFGLHELVLQDWSVESLQKVMDSVENSDAIRKKLSKMIDWYKCYHSVERFAKEIAIL
jgi:hypothetical protein